MEELTINLYKKSFKSEVIIYMGQINSIEDLTNWDGNSDKFLQTNLTITTPITPINIANGITFHGNNNTLFIDVGQNTYVNGLFILSGGNVEDLKIVINSGTLTSSGWLIHSTEENSSFGSVSNVKIMNYVHPTSYISMDANSGGIVGPYAGGAGIDESPTQLTITNCYYQGYIPQYGGGIIGAHSGSQYGTITITGSYVNIIYSPDNDCGGFVGTDASYCNIFSSIVKGNINENNVSGFVGYNSTMCQIINSYSLLSSNGTNCSGFFGTDCTNCSVYTSYHYGALLNESNSYPFYVFESNAAAENENPTNLISNIFTNLSNFTTYNTTISLGQNFSEYVIGDNTPTIGTFDTDVWDIITAPPTLLVFKNSPWSNYTAYDNIPVTIPCILKGTNILTNDGEILVENIKVGMILKSEKGFTEVTKLQQFTIDSIGDNVPYVVPKNKYGIGIPTCDTFLSKKHMLYINENFYHVHHRHKKSNKFIGKIVTYFHISTTNHDDVIYANGLPVETYHLKKIPCSECIRKQKTNVKKCENIL